MNNNKEYDGMMFSCDDTDRMCKLMEPDEQKWYSYASSACRELANEIDSISNGNDNIREMFDCIASAIVGIKGVMLLEDFDDDLVHERVGKEIRDLVVVAGLKAKRGK